MRTDPSLEFPDGFAFEGANLPGRHFNDGVSQSGRERNHLFMNLRGESFANASGVSGLDHLADGRAFAQLDFDRDGHTDLAVVNANNPFFQLFRNLAGDREASGGVIAVRLEGANHTAQPQPGTSPRDGTGARVEMQLGDARTVREYRMGEGLGAQNHARLMMGTGTQGQAEMSVRWPSGEVQRAGKIEAGKLVTFREGRPPVVSAYERIAPPAGNSPASPATLLAEREDPDRRSLRVLTTLATWCEACVDELPRLRELTRLFPQATYWGVPVELGETRSQLEAWGRRHSPAYRLLADLSPAERNAASEQVRTAMGRAALPAAIITDADGHVLQTRWGVPTVSELRALLGSVSGAERP